MTIEDKEILQAGNDLLIANISNAINSPQEKKAELREYLKAVISAGEKIQLIEVEEIKTIKDEKV